MGEQGTVVWWGGVEGVRHRREERVSVCIQIENSFAILGPSYTSRGLGETWRRDR